MESERVELYKDSADEWRWRVVAQNGNTTADSGEGYENRVDALAQAGKLFPNVRVEVVDDAGG